jgi:hypothetical protein
MCLGAVFVLGGVGMAVSQVSSAYPNLCKLITGWVKTSLPEDFPFSSLQINYNYAARKHVDGNNIGPSYIRSLGKHTGGELWTADAFVEATDEDTGEKYVKGGGGQQVLIPVSRTTRGHRTMTWVVSFSSLSCFGPRRGRRGVPERPQSRRWRLHETAPPRRRPRDPTRVYVVIRTPSARCPIAAETARRATVSTIAGPVLLGRLEVVQRQRRALHEALPGDAHLLHRVFS